MSGTVIFEKLFIGGAWKSPAVAARYEIRSPHDGSLVGHAPVGTPADIDRAVAAAREAFDHGPWPKLSVAERVAVMRRFRELYDAKAGLLHRQSPSRVRSDAPTASNMRP